MAVLGLDLSYQHVENGMIRPDMEASLRVASRFDEVIIYRSTGPWSKRWIERRYPTKNFHVKGKSSDWGPHAGFVPYDGRYSKVGHIPAKAQAGTAANRKGMDEGFAATTTLELSWLELRTQLLRPEESPPRHALLAMVPMRSQPWNFHLFSRRSGDRKLFAFRAVFNPHTHRYLIHTVNEAVACYPDLLEAARGTPMKVMTSAEAGANNRPMTGDYDLMAVCPTWRNYMAVSTGTISKPGLVFNGLGAQEGQTFAAGTRMDAVMDMRVNTGAVGRGNRTFQGYTIDGHGTMARGAAVVGHVEEHGDMGNLTPRILRCMNELNAEMNPGDAHTALRRVHHNAESHRHALFGALKAADMWNDGDGFPMTGFHPQSLRDNPRWTYGEVATLENMTEFQEYVEALNDAGYFVPRNWTWRMSVRDRFARFNPFPRGRRELGAPV